MNKLIVLLSIMGLIVAACAPAAQPAAAPAPAPAAAPAAAPAQPQAPVPAAAAAAAAAPQAPVAPAPAAAPAAPVAPKGPQRGGILKVFQQTEAPHFDPIFVRTVTIGDRAMGTYQRLIRFKTGSDVPYGEITLVPDLAESWEISPDGKTYIFHIRKGVKWQNIPPVNGRELTANDVMYTYTRSAQTPGSVNSVWFDSVQSMEATDKYTVKIVTKAPSAPFLTTLADPFAAITAKEVADRDGDFKKTLVGTGPFMVEKRTPNVVIRLKRNPDYWEKGIPYLDAFEVYTIADSSAQLAAFRAGQIDIIGLSRKGEVDSMLASQPKTMVSKHVGLGWCKFHMRTDKPPWNNIKLRQALSVALDRQAEIDTFWEGEGVFIGPGGRWPIWALDVKELGEASKFYNRDVKFARQLLKEAGYPEGAEFDFLLRRSVGFDDRIIRYANDLQEAGIKLKMKPISNAEYIATAYIGKYEGASAGCWPSTSDPGEWHIKVYHPGNVNTNTSYVNETVITKMLEEQRQTLDAEKRLKLVRDIQLYLADKMYYVPLTAGFSYSLTSARVNNYRSSVSFNASDVYRYVWIGE